jgi:hypothetical protein
MKGMIAWNLRKNLILLDYMQEKCGVLGNVPANRVNLLLLIVRQLD